MNEIFNNYNDLHSESFMPMNFLFKYLCQTNMELKEEKS